MYFFLYIHPIFRERKIILILEIIPLTLPYIQWTILTELYPSCWGILLVLKGILQNQYFHILFFFCFVCQDNNINVVHIESRKSQKADSMYDFYVDIETDNIRLQELINRLKKQVASIKLNDTPVPQSPASVNRALNPRGEYSFV